MKKKRVEENRRESKRVKKKRVEERRRDSTRVKKVLIAIDSRGTQWPYLGLVSECFRAVFWELGFERLDSTCLLDLNRNPVDHRRAHDVVSEIHLRW